MPVEHNTVGKPTAALPRDVAGHLWRCYSVGVQRTEWRTDGGLWSVGRFSGLETYWARVRGEVIRNAAGKAKRFRTMESAMREAVRHA